jgi:hypothetical protein
MWNKKVLLKWETSRGVKKLFKIDIIKINKKHERLLK